MGFTAKKKVISKIISRFRVYNSKLTVIKIVKYGFVYMVIAVYDVNNGFMEMDPLYLYYPLPEMISGYCPTANLKRFGRIQKWGKVIYDTYSGILE